MDMERFRRQDAKRAGQRIRKAVKELQDLNIIDEGGELIDKELPADMQPGSKCDL